MLALRKKPFDRSTTMEAAGKAKARGRTSKAIALYRQVLERDPDDHTVHCRLAPLLAEAGDTGSAWRSFVKAAEGYMKLGFSDKAIGVYTQASKHLPREPGVWDALVTLQLKKGLEADALATLLRARTHFTGKNHMDNALKILRRAFSISPWHFEATRELAVLLVKKGKKDEAIRLYEGLEERCEVKRELRKVRWALFRLRPAPSTAFAWVRTAVSRA